MNTHDIELPQGYAGRPFGYSGELYTEGQMRAAIAAAIAATLQSQDREDAERYRWLRDKSRVFKQDPDMSGNHYWMIQSNGLLRGATLDAAIDHARAALAQEQGGADGSR